MTTKLAVPAGFERQGNRMVRSLAPKAEDAPPPEKVPTDPAAADMTCPKCGAAVQAGWKYCPECGTEQAAPPNDAAPPADAQAFARWALAELGERSLDGARGAITSQREQAARTQVAEGRLSVLERERLLEQATADGRLAPAEAWAFTVDAKGEKVKTFSAWAGPPSADGKTGQSIEQLRAYVSRRTPSAAVRPATPARAAPAAESDEHARRTGRDPVVYAQIKETIQSRSAVEVT